MDSFEFALKMELDGKAYYEKLAQETAQASLKKIFYSLAQDELKHFETIQALHEQHENKVVSMVDSDVLEEARNVFQALLSERNTVGKLSTGLAAYQHAMSIEAKSQKFYEDAAKHEKNPEAARLLMKIADEEKKHFSIMDNIYTFMLAPHNFLAWGEFSNLTEYY